MAGWSSPLEVNYDSWDDTRRVERVERTPYSSQERRLEMSALHGDDDCATCRAEESPRKSAATKTVAHGVGSYRPKLDLWEEVRGWIGLLTIPTLILMIAIGMVAVDHSYAECRMKNPDNVIEMCE